MKNVLICFAIVFLYKLISNVINYFAMNFYINRHLNFLTKGDETFITYQNSIRKLVKRANVSSTFIPVVQPIGYGRLASYQADVLDSVANRREDVASALYSAMMVAKGTFRSRIIECFSPRYWIDLVIFLPKHFVEFLGLDGEKWPAKVLQSIWWLLTPAAIIFRNNLYLWIREIINQIH